MNINSFEAFLQHLDIPKTCELNKSVFKKLFLDIGEMDATAKKCLADDVKKVRWLYTLKPSTINIAPYHDKVREYPEVAVLHVGLSNPHRIGRITHFINRSIPYPLVLFFTLDVENETSMAVSLADKRINQADKEKWVFEDNIRSDWIRLGKQSASQTEFLTSLNITELPFKDFWTFYQALMNRVIAINCAVHIGSFVLNADWSETGSGRLDKLRELEKLCVQKREITNKLKKEKQMGKQVELNTRVKNFNYRIADIKASL